MQRIPVLALRTNDRIKVGMERFERVAGIDDREPGVVKVTVASGNVHNFGYHDIAVIASDDMAAIRKHVFRSLTAS